MSAVAAGLPAAAPTPLGTVAQPCEPPVAGLACIAGGAFYRGALLGPANQRPLQSIWMPTYYMDVYEVTYGDYQDCVRDKKCKRSKPYYNDYDRPKQPMVGMTWYDAVQFCAARGKHLPSEAEWEKAARGPDGQTHPWGSQPADCTRAVIMDKTGRGCGTPKKPPSPEKGRTLEVGTRPAGAYGLYDMSGNAWEWVADWFTVSYAKCGADCAGPNPKGPCGGKEPCGNHDNKIVRGGSWYWPPHMATAMWRRPHVPSNKNPYHHFGFRCAATVEQARALRAVAP
ncbi:MAG: formylglycine-generating enzyme family protein [Myxococcales bacterium]|nr:formylglycine-generating enzyme family protein [Myxococcales bacterium]